MLGTAEKQAMATTLQVPSEIAAVSISDPCPLPPLPCYSTKQNIKIRTHCGLHRQHKSSRHDALACLVAPPLIDRNRSLLRSLDLTIPSGRCAGSGSRTSPRAQTRRSPAASGRRRIRSLAANTQPAIPRAHLAPYRNAHVNRHRFAMLGGTLSGLDTSPRLVMLFKCFSERSRIFAGAA